MELEDYRLLVDFGFMLIIWAVQLVIYPGFKYYTPKNLISWHRLYTKRVTFIVLPLMTSQLILSVVQLGRELNAYSLSSFIIIIILWLLTFLIFVPLHQTIDRGEASSETTIKLVDYNWIRTILWTLLSLMTWYYNSSI